MIYINTLSTLVYLSFQIEKGKISVFFLSIHKNRPFYFKVREGLEAQVWSKLKKRTWWGFCLYLQRRACERAPSARVFVLLLFMPEIEFFNKFCIRLALFLILVPIIRISGQHLLPGGCHPGAAVAHGSV